MTGGRGEVARTVDAEVAGYWVGTERVLLRSRATDAAGFEAWAPPEVAPHLVTGTPVTIYFDDQDRIIGWYLPGPRLGTRVDLDGDPD